MRIAHLNICASGPALEKPQTAILSFARRKFDIICLTEIKVSKANENNFTHKDYDTFLNLPPDHLNNAPKEGVATLIRKEICTDSLEVTFPKEGRATYIKLKVNEVMFDCLCLYAPAQSDAVSSTFYEEILDSRADSNEVENRITIGDIKRFLTLP